MKKLFTLLLLSFLLLSFTNDKSKTPETRLVIFEVSYINDFEVFYWKHKTNDPNFKSLYKLVMVKSTIDRLVIKDVKSGTELGTIGGRPDIEFLINLYHKKFYSQEVIDDLTLSTKL